MMNIKMKKMDIKKKILADKLKIFIFIISFIFVTASCIKPSSGFVLQNFEVSNQKLDSLINILTRDYKKNIRKKKAKLLCLNF